MTPSYTPLPILPSTLPNMGSFLLIATLTGFIVGLPLIHMGSRGLDFLEGLFPYFTETDSSHVWMQVIYLLLHFILLICNHTFLGHLQDTQYIFIPYWIF